jgi:hypothetical protein
MPDKLEINITNKATSSSPFDWINLNRLGVRVGKIRVSMHDNILTIYSINVFPEFEGNGYARRSLDFFKGSFNKIIADRVRHKATGFWDKMGFLNSGNGSYVYDKEAQRFTSQYSLSPEAKGREPCAPNKIERRDHSVLGIN